MHRYVYIYIYIIIYVCIYIYIYTHIAILLDFARVQDQRPNCGDWHDAFFDSAQAPRHPRNLP